MARLIVKSPYFKGGGAKPAGGYLRYIATRERVEILPDDRPPTKRQTQLIEKLTKDFPDTKTLLEYGDYTAHPTKFSASQFLTLAMGKLGQGAENRRLRKVYRNPSSRGAAGRTRTVR